MKKNNTAVIAVGGVGGILAAGLAAYLLTRPPPPSECVEGATQEVDCGDGSGTLKPQVCTGGAWVDDGACYECVEGDVQVCENAPSIATANCTRHEGGTDTIPHWVPTGNQCPAANFPPTVDLILGITGDLAISAGLGASIDQDGSIVDYLIDWGDGTQTTAADTGGAWDTEHIYAAAGTYTVTLTLWDDDGASASQSKTATVGNVPVNGVLRVTQSGTPMYCLIDVIRNGVVVGTTTWGVDWVQYPPGTYTLHFYGGTFNPFTSNPMEILSSLTTTVTVNLLANTYTVIIG